MSKLTFKYEGHELLSVCKYLEYSYHKPLRNIYKRTTSDKEKKKKTIERHPYKHQCEDKIYRYLYKSEVKGRVYIQKREYLKAMCTGNVNKTHSTY